MSFALIVSQTLHRFLSPHRHATMTFKRSLDGEHEKKMNDSTNPTTSPTLQIPSDSRSQEESAYPGYHLAYEVKKLMYASFVTLTVTLSRCSLSLSLSLCLFYTTRLVVSHTLAVVEKSALPNCMRIACVFQCTSRSFLLFPA